MTYYHGRDGSRPFYGNYIFITNSMEYAGLYSKDGFIYEVELLCSIDKIFSIKNDKDLQVLKDNLAPVILEKLNINEEIDWSEMSYLYSDDFDSMEVWLQSLGYKGIKLKERSNVDSIYIFDQSDVSLVSKIKV